MSGGILVAKFQLDLTSAQQRSLWILAACIVESTRQDWAGCWLHCLVTALFVVPLGRGFLVGVISKPHSTFDIKVLLN